MAANIYDIDNWAVDTNYKTHDIVKNGDDYYYALSNHTSPNVGPFNTTYTFANNYRNLWGGMTTDDNGDIKPKFVWIPSYNFSVNNNPRVKVIRFGDGYEQRIKDGINNILLDIELMFENRSLIESMAILHFLYVRQGRESFIFRPLAPYAKNKRFVCRSWTDSQNFYENYSIKAKFEETPS